MKEKESILSPCDGEIISLDKIADEVFSSGVMGEGFGILPSGNKILSPVSGKIENAYKTGHAYSILTDDGIDVLVHIGIDTVELDGECFEKMTQSGEKVKAGELLCVAHTEKIRKKGFDPAVVVVITNSERLHSTELYEGKAYAQDKVFLYEIK